MAITKDPIFPRNIYLTVVDPGTEDQYFEIHNEREDGVNFDPTKIASYRLFDVSTFKKETVVNEVESED